jgi:Ca2+-binding RTX toxin-like protein
VSYRQPRARPRSRTAVATASPDPVAAGGAITLSNLQQTANVPGSIFVAGYNAGVLSEGENTIPATATTKIEGTNTVEGVLQTNVASTSITTTINDPDDEPGTGDETATDGTFTANYNNLVFTAGPSGVALFRQDTQPVPASGGFPSTTGSLIIVASVGFPVRFNCSPATVTPPDPGTVTPIDPAPTFASTTITPAPPTGEECFGVSSDDLNPVVTDDGTAYVSDGVSTAVNPGAKLDENSFTGTAGNDVIIGTPGKDYVVGMSGNDKICTLAGNDRPTGRKGNDQVDAGADNDSIWGQPGDDTLLGGLGNDHITGQGGNDDVNGGDGTDTCNGGAGTDTGASCETSSNIP